MTLANASEQALARALAAKRKERRKSSPRKPSQKRVEPKGEGQRQPRERDPAFLSWLHEDIPCIACEVELRLPSMRWDCGPIEAAHQKMNLDLPGWVKFSGSRVHDRQCCPLCRWHHQLAPNACDKAQAKFWTRILGDPETGARYCLALYAAFKAGTPGAAVVHAFTTTAASDAGRAIGDKR